MDPPSVDMSSSKVKAQINAKASLRARHENGAAMTRAAHCCIQHQRGPSAENSMSGSAPDGSSLMVLLQQGRTCLLPAAAAAGTRAFLLGSDAQ